MKQFKKGVTLIELMIVIVIIAVLALILYPSYANSVRKTKRSDALKSIQDVSHRLEKYFTFCNQYTEEMGKDLSDCTGLGLSATDTTDSIPSELGLYNIDVTAICTTVGSVTTCMGYTVEAEATGSQTDDTNCQKFFLTSTGAKTSEDSSTATTDCWS